MLVACLLTLAAVVVPTSAAFASVCANEQVRQESNINPATGQPYSAGLPDCRAYELVSSGNKNDVDAMLSPLSATSHSGAFNFGLVSEDGGHLLWEKSFEPYSDPNNGEYSVYQSSRGSGGWSQSTLVPPSTADSRLKIAAASSDFSTVLIESEPVPATGGLKPAPGANTTLVERGPDGSYTTIASGSNTLFAPFAKLSADGSHAFFQTEAQLAGDTHTTGNQVYEWTSAGGLRVVGVDSAGNPTSSCGAVLASGTRLSYPDVSQNGSRVFFESPDPREKVGALGNGNPACQRPSELYVRENATTTVEISKAPAGAAECEAGLSECAAVFVGASADDSRVFFVTRSQLTPDKTNTDPDLYEYDVTTGVLSRLSVGPPGYDDANVTGPSAAVGGESAESAIVSSDGSHVYFTGKGQLVPGAGASPTTNEENGTNNLYLYANGRVSFIATVGSGTANSTVPPPVSPTVDPLGVEVAGVTSDGSDLVFDTASQLTAFNSQGQGELYRYDAPSATISCVSCSPTLTPPGAGSLVASFHTSFPAHGSVGQFAGLSNDGTTVFFASADQLLPAATNDFAAEPGSPIYDIYEWHHGVLSLISTGTSLSSDFLLGASPSGSDVFFLTADPLTGQDGDHAYDIYDASVEGGFPAPTTPAPCASVETCRSMLATPPVAVTPASVSVSSAGNLTPPSTSSLPTPKESGPTPLTRTQKLAKALKACKHDRSHDRRVACENLAHNRYGAKHEPSKHHHR